jgi:hypothetical protein
MRINIQENNKTTKINGNNRMSRSIHNTQESSRTSTMKICTQENNSIKKMVITKITLKKHRICTISIQENPNTRKLLSINESKSSNTQENSRLNSNMKDILVNSMNGSITIIRIDSTNNNLNSNKEKDRWLVQDHSHPSNTLAILLVVNHKLHSDI